MRGRKRGNSAVYVIIVDYNKKRIPEWGDGNLIRRVFPNADVVSIIKKESPNEGTETLYCGLLKKQTAIKKESPNEGTETRIGRWSLRSTCGQ